MRLNGTEGEFTDPVTGHICTIRDDPASPFPLGAAHPGCPQLAAIYPDLDAFYCQRCGHNGRVAGAWVMSLLGGEA